MEESSQEHRALIEAAVTIIEELKVDWIDTFQLCETLEALDLSYNTANLIRAMKLYEQETSWRVLHEGGKNVPGYYAKQFYDVLRLFHGGDDAIAEREHGHDLNGCAARFIEFLSGLDPDYGMIIGFLKDERGFDDATAVASMCSYVLHNRLHMSVPRQDLFAQVVWSPEERVCEICQLSYTMKYPGQPPVCLDPECGTEYHERRRKANAERLLQEREAQEDLEHASV